MTVRHIPRDLLARDAAGACGGSGIPLGRPPNAAPSAPSSAVLRVLGGRIVEPRRALRRAEASQRRCPPRSRITARNMPATRAAAGGGAYHFRLPGQYYDAESGLHYNYFRDYDPTIGRYVESDPIGLAGGWNTYGYVGGNPVGRVDPWGLAMCTYEISSGQMTCWGSGTGQSGEDLYMYNGKFASGNNVVPGCKNNPSCSGLRDVGPIPPGRWTWDPDPGNNTKPNGLRLNPGFDIDPLRDGGFLTHSCQNAFGPSTNPDSLCSQGCVTGQPDTVKGLNEFLNSDPEADTLDVIPYPGQPTLDIPGT